MKRLRRWVSWHWVNNNSTTLWFHASIVKSYELFYFILGILIFHSLIKMPICMCTHKLWSTIVGLCGLDQSKWLCSSYLQLFTLENLHIYLLWLTCIIEHRGPTYGPFSLLPSYTNTTSTFHRRMYFTHSTYIIWPLLFDVVPIRKIGLSDKFKWI